MLTGNPERKAVYSSASIHQRRKRILTEARRMIADVGLDGFSVRLLCRNADVAQRTLYNAFQSKDRLIALAIREAYEDVNRYIRYRTEVDTLNGIIDRLIAVNTRNLRARNYTKAVVSLYFSPSISPDVWNALRSMVFLNLRQWLDRLHREGGLQPWINVEIAAGDFANIEYATINDWAVGRLTDEQYIPRLVNAVLSYALGILKGEERAMAAAMMEQLHATGKLPEFPKPVFDPSVEAPAPAEVEDA
ncbi:TetR/AcrR family transcriptional regulator [Novosphingobium sp. ERN07]|uniref:TetR/AcrR family transcriptional regulator n=1 Tax=Novosphingobium sp. ERN07 TaxID=2726187 RepID=UPI0014571AE7|nr:TetR/AcrR family transcriptional regulator [Novosphingobium sp. ERN07]NLR73212.1 TetR/AcrR family transcriptional regulator [Novosphingobium sp. ERN07]